MVMNTFRSKLRRRKNELFRRSSDEDEEWQFVAFNASVYPTQGAINGPKCKQVSNGSISSNDSGESRLRPWALKRATWHDSPPPIPPHTASRYGQVPPVVPPHEIYPASVPSWYTPNEANKDSAFSKQCLEQIAEIPHAREVKRCAHKVDTKQRTRPLSLEEEIIAPLVPPHSSPIVPPHGRPAVPPHTLSFHESFEIPPVPAHAVTPPPLPPHGKSFLTDVKNFLNDGIIFQKTDERKHSSEKNRHDVPGDATDDSSVNGDTLYSEVVKQCKTNFAEKIFNEYIPPEPISVDEEDHEEFIPEVKPILSRRSPKICRSRSDDIAYIKKEKAGSGKEQRKSDPGGGLNHQPSSTSLEDETNDEADNTADQPSALPTTDLSNILKSQSKKKSSSISRSESCKEKQNARKQARENRKNSDPNIPTSKAGDVDGENQLFQSGSSSNSSLSQGQESPGNSTEQVQAYASALDNDSDIEAEVDLPDWKSRLSSEELDQLTSRQRKRQDTINELFHTEQSHVRTLKVLQSLFYEPLRQSSYLPSELLDRLFPNLEQVLRFHSSFNKSMKKRRADSSIVTHVGDIVSSMFLGESGTSFMEAAAVFVAYQGSALEDLRHRLKRDPKLAGFLQDQENHFHCRRLQLKDMLPAGFQRLTKYPLLLESLLSYTDKSLEEEYEQICKSLEQSKEILLYVNSAVENAENNRRLIEIQRRLDQTSLAKNKHGNCEELRGELDLTKHNLKYEGSLTWKTKGQKNIDLHVLILEDCVVLLQKDSDKYILKYHSINKASGKDDNKLNHSPIIKFGTFLFRPVATDKCAFFLVLTQSTLGAQIYELVTISPSERNVWLRHLHEAQSAYESREGRNRRSHPPAPLPDNEDVAPPSEQMRDVEDNVVNDAIEPAETERTKESDIPSNQSPPPPDQQLKKTENPTGRARRLQEVQIIQIVEGPALIQPSEVTVSQGVVLSAQPVLTPLELLRRKDLKIRQELEDKQNLIADILNIPREHFESVADMASDVGIANKEPKELVLGAIFQAKKLQETLNDAQSVSISDVIAAQADASKAHSLPLYQAPMERLLNISGTLNLLLDSLLSLVSERDDERERMRKELLASRERLHQFHTPKATESTCGGSSTITPQSSRPNSYISVTSAEPSDTTEQQCHDDVKKEECESEVQLEPSLNEQENTNMDDLESNEKDTLEST